MERKETLRRGDFGSVEEEMLRPENQMLCCIADDVCAAVHSRPPALRSRNATRFTSRGVNVHCRQVLYADRIEIDAIFGGQVENALASVSWNARIMSLTFGTPIAPHLLAQCVAFHLHVSFSYVFFC